MANVKQTYRCPKATFRKEVANLLEIEEDEVELIMDAFMCAMMNCLLVEGYDCVKVLPCLEVWKVSNVKGEEPRKIILNGKEITLDLKTNPDIEGESKKNRIYRGK